MDAAKRRELLESAERVMLRDHPLIPLYFYVNKHLVKPQVQGWYDNVMNVVYSKDLALRCAVRRRTCAAACIELGAFARLWRRPAARRSGRAGIASTSDGCRCVAWRRASAGAAGAAHRSGMCSAVCSASAMPRLS